MFSFHASSFRQTPDGHHSIHCLLALRAQRRSCGWSCSTCKTLHLVNSVGNIARPPPLIKRSLCAMFHFLCVWNTNTPKLCDMVVWKCKTAILFISWQTLLVLSEEISADNFTKHFYLSLFLIKVMYEWTEVTDFKFNYIIKTTFHSTLQFEQTTHAVRNSLMIILMISLSELKSGNGQAVAIYSLVHYRRATQRTGRTTKRITDYTWTCFDTWCLMRINDEAVKHSHSRLVKCG